MPAVRFLDLSPVVLQVPYDHQRHLVVDSYRKRITVEVSQIFSTDRAR